MAPVTKTINPLHFEDLEPRRFEDLVRQVIYDFRTWSALEATGRQGVDDGFDARGWETVTLSKSVEEESVDEDVEAHEDDRIWLIQCKRERTITPKKLDAHLKAINEEEVAKLHGIIFVAACDFTKKSRDTYRSWCIEKGIKEFYLWGKAELEDMLYLPKNDHLLFGYFGISIQINKRSTKTILRSRLATKRQVIRHIGDIEDYGHSLVLLRDTDTDKYPYSGDVADFDEKPLWRVYEFLGHYENGIKILIRTHFAYIKEDGSSWDADENIKTNKHYEDPWPAKSDRKLEEKARKFWSQLPEENQATLEVIGLLPYDDILAIDENGDLHFPHPHVYVPFNPEYGPFSDGAYGQLVTYHPTRSEYDALRENQISRFPDVYPRDEDEH
ncbi:MAG: restriction endonuclease [Candidatus Thiodiazotropha sp. (ex Monitilora ramsayi)]|nr:restriction endonuclease [Candidatus Thiodiazotropha sp. (ex Monitilora ramsayi)]